MAGTISKQSQELEEGTLLTLANWQPFNAVNVDWAPAEKPSWVKLVTLYPDAQGRASYVDQSHEPASDYQWRAQQPPEEDFAYTG